MQSMTCKQIQNQTGTVVRKVSMHVHFSQASLSDHSDTPPWVNNGFVENKEVCLSTVLDVMSDWSCGFCVWCLMWECRHIVLPISSFVLTSQSATSWFCPRWTTSTKKSIKGKWVWLCSFFFLWTVTTYITNSTLPTLIRLSLQALDTPQCVPGYEYIELSKENIFMTSSKQQSNGKHIGVHRPHLHEIQHGVWVWPNIILGKSSVWKSQGSGILVETQLRWKSTSSAMINLAHPISNDKQPLCYYSVVQFTANT